MFHRRLRVPTLMGISGLLISAFALAPATSAVAAPTWPTHICAGTPKHPGTLSGTHWNVLVRGICNVDKGPAVVLNNLVVGRNSVLLAAYGRHKSRLWVGHDIIVTRSAVAILGCLSKKYLGHPIFPCLDDPHPGHPTLKSHEIIIGDVIGEKALGIVMHNSWVGHDVIQKGGGGGFTCTPVGFFKAIGSPAYSDYENNQVVGSMFIRSLRTCWLGVIRDWVGNSVTVSRNKAADPDAMEVTSNVVLRNLTCFKNSPAVQFGDGHGFANRVGLHALFQCGFNVLLPNPVGQNHHFEHISVHLHDR
jgi:hypothetical protein